MCQAKWQLQPLQDAHEFPGATASGHRARTPANTLRGDKVVELQVLRMPQEAQGVHLFLNGGNGSPASGKLTSLTSSRRGKEVASRPGRALGRALGRGQLEGREALAKAAAVRSLLLSRSHTPWKSG